MSTAVLAINCQNENLFGDYCVANAAEMLYRIQSICEKARAVSVPIVYLQDNTLGSAEAPDRQIALLLTPQPGDVVVRKSFPDGFYQTELKERLDELGITELVVVGFKTDEDVATTCRAAVIAGYDVFLVSDAHSTRENSFMLPHQLIQYYNYILDEFGLEDSFGNGEHWLEVTTSDELSF